MEKKEIELVCAKCGAISQKFEQVDTLLIRRCSECGGVVFRIRERKSALLYAKSLYVGNGDGDRIEVFKAVDVEDAVQGLIKEIRKKAYDREFGKSVSDVVPVVYPVVDLEDVIELIKKWFADVISKEGEE